MSAAYPRPGVFDEQLARHYDQTRSLTRSAMAGVVAMLTEELARAQPVLEIGVGTGRIALPLAQAGIEVMGADPSLPMLLRLLEKVGGAGAPLTLLRGDATELPFGDGSFGSGLICHVLHLIPDWERALSELVRVVRRPGVILNELASGDGGPPRDIRIHFHECAGVVPYSTYGVRDGASVDAAMRDLGATVRELPPIVETRTISAGDLIDRLEMGTHSSNSTLTADARRRAAEETRLWARQEFGDLAAPIRQEHVLRWRAYDLRPS